jgi:hypothetical protein
MWQITTLSSLAEATIGLPSQRMVVSNTNVKAMSLKNNVLRIMILLLYCFLNRAGLLDAFTKAYPTLLCKCIRESIFSHKTNWVMAVGRD